MATYQGAIYKECTGCGCDHPGQLVLLKEKGAEEPLCFTCMRVLTAPYQVIRWINKYGKLQGLPGANKP
jgi:hypothetical protein